MKEPYVLKHAQAFLAFLNASLGQVEKATEPFWRGQQTSLYYNSSLALIDRIFLQELETWR